MSDDEARGDEVYQPDDAEVQDDAGLMDPLDTLDDRGVDPALDEGYSPPERPREAEHYGTTANEQRSGESLDQRLSEEEPDVEAPPGNGIGDAPGATGEPVDPEAGEDRSGRLVADDEGVPGHSDEVDDTAASDAGIAGGAASAEEAAVHTVDDPEAGVEEG
ncbi:DUF5709 domain-containing protein [Streptomyces sp. PTM05]|uniref:DUF5709 domain-containing protein n=1 Tax=Streptantibioticus parmotrematis TaxID=2873249 RepID=A0ABS7QJU1_9ACTN|nr:DUF5709 domain-containing protein [Streptantibioticus parmotrematis]MBY8883445.1 DUF5709 domain-containing protein [Streptantibioticus parmotrematis]